ASTRLRIQRPASSPYLLSGILRCERCRSTMSGQTFRADSTHTMQRDGRSGGTHRETRFRYTCYLRRVGGPCDAPSAAQEQIEADLVAILRAVRLPAGSAEWVEARAGELGRSRASKTTPASTKLLEGRLQRLRDL